jgi:hypothetical protein
MREALIDAETDQEAGVNGFQHQGTGKREQSSDFAMGNV